MEWSVFEQQHPGVEITKNTFCETPYLKFTPKNIDVDLPTIILYHGWHSSKEFKRFDAMLLASFGYPVIVPDALFHGERGAIDYDAPSSLDQYLWKIIFQSVEESDRLISHLHQVHGIKEERMVVMGSSMGAMTASGVFAKHEKLKGLAALNGLNAWSVAIKKGAMPKSELFADLIEQYDLLAHRERIQNRPVLLMHGVEDQSIPIQLQRDFYEEVKSEGDHVQMVEFDQVGHRVTMNMMQKLVMWLNRECRIK